MNHKTAMWQAYRYMGHEVVIIQQWHNLFGKPMIRFAADHDGDLIADGMPEEKFLALAVFLGEWASEIVEGSN